MRWLVEVNRLGQVVLLPYSHLLRSSNHRRLKSYKRFVILPTSLLLASYYTQRQRYYVFRLDRAFPQELGNRAGRIGRGTLQARVSRSANLKSSAQVIDLKTSLQQSDRDALRSAATTVSTHVAIGSLVGVGLGVLLAYRIRSSRASMFRAFKTAEQPQAIKFAGGREGKLQYSPRSLRDRS